jgi:hypothetical protein
MILKGQESKGTGQPIEKVYFSKYTLFQSIYETKMEGRFVAVMEKTKLTMS